MSVWNNHPISMLKGRVIIEVRGLEAESEEAIFVCADGTKWRMRHEQDCCENVVIQDVCGDVDDLIAQVVDAREETNSKSHPEGYTAKYTPESFTWTFYVIQTTKGAVTIRWLGESNGYYGEDVEFELMEGTP